MFLVKVLGATESPEAVFLCVDQLLPSVEGGAQTAATVHRSEELGLCQAANGTKTLNTGTDCHQQYFYFSPSSP